MDGKMEKLKSYIETWIDGKSIKGIRVSPYDIYTCIDAYNTLVKKEKFEFISGNVKTIFDKCGIPTKEKGIGWVAFI